MFFISGQVIALFTFPGVIVHEAAHMLFCKWRGIAIFEVCFFRFGNPAGYVVHEEIKDFNSAFLVAVGPFIINSLLCIFICLPAVLPIRFFNINEPLSYVLAWLGVSIGMHAFPSNHDAKGLLAQAKIAIKAKSMLAIVSFPIVGLIYLANILSFFWVDYLYGIGIGLVLPSYLFG